MRRVLLILAAIVGVLAVFLLVARSKGNGGERPVSSFQQKTEAKMAAADLFRAFQEDEAGANEQYLNKVVEVTGVVSTVRNNDRGSSSVLLASDDPHLGVSCKLDTRQVGKQAAFEIGETVTLKGVCTGLLQHVELVDCGW